METTKSQKVEKEKVILAIIYRKDGDMAIEFPNHRDVSNPELFGFLSTYCDYLYENMRRGLGGDKGW